MGANRYAKKIDANQPAIVEDLRKLGVSVAVNHDDLLVGWHDKTYWFEIKDEHCVSKKTGEILESEKKKSQKELEKSWRGHYRIVFKLEQILEDIGIVIK